jgi:hypothetical protein
MHFISTQTASSSASLQFTGLGSTYNTLFLNCNGLVPATNSVSLELQYGEGATPTWETANYSFGGRYATQGGSSGNEDGASGSSIGLDGGVSNSAGANISFKAWISNVGSSSLYKQTVALIGAYEVSSTFEDWVAASGTYTGDTNAVTAIRILMSSGNITSGTCSLYGLN